MSIFDPKTIELVALSASVAANCVPCLKYHLAQAQKQGLTQEEIGEIIRIAKMVKQRPANEIDEVAAAFLGVKEQAPCAGSCGCLGKDS
jgi:AhpD family alkylhydroperoxidase